MRLLVVRLLVRYLPRSRLGSPPWASLDEAWPVALGPCRERWARRPPSLPATAPAPALNAALHLRGRRAGRPPCRRALAAGPVRCKQPFYDRLGEEVWARRPVGHAGWWANRPERDRGMRRRPTPPAQHPLKSTTRSSTPRPPPAIRPPDRGHFTQRRGSKAVSWRRRSAKAYWLLTPADRRRARGHVNWRGGWERTAAQHHGSQE